MSKNLFARETVGLSLPFFTMANIRRKLGVSTATNRIEHARIEPSKTSARAFSADPLILDDLAIDVVDATESRDLYDILFGRDRTASIIATSNRGPDEWLATFADPIRAQRALDRSSSSAYDLVIESNSNRPRLKPHLATATVKTVSKERSR